MESRLLAFVVLLMIVFIFINEVIHITRFIINYYNIKESAKLTKLPCDKVYTEAETERFQIANKIFSLLLPNDSFNCKTYMILVLIFAIILYLYIADMYFSYLYNSFANNSKLKWFVLFVIAHFVIFLIMNIILRYAPYDEKGYENMYRSNGQDGLNTHAYFTLFYFLICFIILLHYILNREYITSTRWYMYLLYAFIYLVGLHFLFFMIVIVESFKNNKTPWNYAPGNIGDWSADISYASENYFYYNYLKLDEAPYFFRLSQTDLDPFRYNIHNSFAVKTIKEYVIGLFIIICCFAIVFVGYIVLLMIGIEDKYIEKIWKFIKNLYQILIPIIVMFILLTFIIITTDYNTAVNKHILFDRNAVYKYDLMKLNNVVTPYIYMHSFYNNSNTNQNKDYLYNYIVFNVLISYFTNYLNIFNINSNKELPYHKYYNNLDNYFKDLNYFSNTNKQFNVIDNNDRIDDEKFKLYYEEIYDLIFEKDILLQTKRSDIENNFINKIFKNIYDGDNNVETKLISELSNFKNIEIDSDNNNIKLIPDKDSYKVDKSISKITTFIDNNGIFQRLKINIYRLFQIFEKFNDNLEDYNNIDKTTTNGSKRNNILNHLQFFHEDNDKDSNCISYKFVLKKTFIIADNNNFESLKQADYDKYETSYGNIIKRTINTFLLHIISLYKDYNTMIVTQNDSDYVKQFNESMRSTIIVIKDTQTKKELLNDNKKLIYMFYTLNNIQIPMKSNQNYLQYLITNNAYRITDEKYEFKLIDSTEDIDISKNDKLLTDDKLLTEISHDNDNVKKTYANGIQASKIFETYNNNIMNYNDNHETITNNANRTVSHMIPTYIFNILLVFTVYQIVKSDSQKSFPYVI